jgi:hypothetical protein
MKCSQQGLNSYILKLNGISRAGTPEKFAGVKFCMVHSVTCTISFQKILRHFYIVLATSMIKRLNPYLFLRLSKAHEK